MRDRIVSSSTPWRRGKLLDGGPDGIAKRINLKDALQRAILHESIAIVDMLLDRMGSYKTCDTRSFPGACLGDEVNSGLPLDDGYDATAYRISMNDALEYGIRHGKVGIVDNLLNRKLSYTPRGADVLQETIILDQALEYAIANHQKGTVRMLLDHSLERGKWFEAAPGTFSHQNW